MLTRHDILNFNNHALANHENIQLHKKLNEIVFRSKDPSTNMDDGRDDIITYFFLIKT